MNDNLIAGAERKPASMLLVGLVALCLCTPLTATAQGTRTVTPQGFEFPVNTPMLKYHFPREGISATAFKGTWIAENAEEIRPNFEINSAEFKPGNQPVLYFTLGKPKGNWPKGLYRLEVRADGKLVHTAKFVIR